MKKFDLPQDKNPSGISPRCALEEVLRNGARKMLQEAIEAEVVEYIHFIKTYEMKRADGW